MRKLLWILVMSMCLIPASAQTTVSLGLPATGAGSTNVLLSTSTTTNRYSKTISVYTAAEIIANGGVAGIITSLAWDKQGIGEYQLGDAEITVYLKHVTNSNWATIPDYNIEVATATQVFTSNTYSIPTGTGWKSVNFTTPFTWNGIDNIAVFVTWYRPGTPTSAISWGRSTAVDANATRVGSSASLVMLVNDNRPVVQFVFNVASPCSVPTGLAVTGVKQDSANIQWNAVAGATGYEYAVITSATPPANGTATTGLMHNATGLSASTTYYVHIRTICGTATFSPWTTIPFTTLNPVICPDPAPISVSNITTTGADILWTAVSGAVGYQYSVSTNGVPPTGGFNTIAATFNTSVLTPGTTYYIHVRTECSGGMFSNWVTRQFMTLQPPCLQPAPAVINITTSTIDINWSPVAGAVGYEFSVTNSSLPPSAGTNTTLTAQTIAGLSDNTTYYLHVRTNCGTGGFSTWATLSFTTASYCSAPIAIFSNITANSVDINWNAVAGAVHYEYVLSGNIIPPTAGTSTAGLNYNANGLQHGTQYYMHMRSLCGTDVSKWSTAGVVTLTETGIKNIANSVELTVYPNPAKDHITISAGSKIKEIRLYSAIGRLIMTQPANNDKGTIDISGFAPGIYHIRLQTETGPANRQISITR